MVSTGSMIFNTSCFSGAVYSILCLIMDDGFLHILGWLFLTILNLIWIVFLVASWPAREKRAARICLFILVLQNTTIISLIGSQSGSANIILIAGFFIMFSGLTAITLPWKSPAQLEIPGPQNRVDERDALFHRFLRLTPGSREFRQYYTEHPENLDMDDQIRRLPSFAGPGSVTFDPLASLYQKAVFDILSRFIGHVPDNNTATSDDSGADIPTDTMTARLKHFAAYLGADLTGSTRLNPSYVYSHIGRGPGRWGAPIELKHSHALVIAVEMRHDMVRHAPGIPELTETARSYCNTAGIAMILARYIQLIGFEARAHIDADYRVMCVPIAVDAGLGELGRIGLLITKRYGPRVRLAVVTTNLPLSEDSRDIFGVQDFCSLCRKCADNCPSGAIDTGEKKPRNGVIKWQSRQELCYRYWRLHGTDCGICLKVCPYSHPHSVFHSAVRRIIQRNPLARRLAVRGDDLFYGKKPAHPIHNPEWMADHGIT